MTEVQTIYICTSGEYSDYGINAVFTDRELAEAYARDFSRDSYGGKIEVEEWTANITLDGKWAHIKATCEWGVTPTPDS